MRICFLTALRQELFYLLLPAICFPATAMIAQKPAPLPSTDAATYTNKLAVMPLLFTENLGQVVGTDGKPQPGILFTARSAGARLFLTATGIHYQFERTAANIINDRRHSQSATLQGGHNISRTVNVQTHRFTLSLQGSNPAPRVRKEELSTFTQNFFLTQCPAGIIAVRSYSRLVYEDVYPGIDWVIYTASAGNTNAGLKYDFIVHPGVDPKQIRLSINGAQKVQIGTDGTLHMRTKLGLVKEAPPVSFCGGARIATAFVQQPDGTIGFATGKYNERETLTIDPAVTWATYYGGTGEEDGYACAVDKTGNVYLSGRTTSLSGIAGGGFQTASSGGGDAFLVKFDAAGNRIWATYFGGSGYEYGVDCAVDATGNIYLAGSTSSSSNIASGGFQNTFGGNGGLSYKGDAFLAKFNSSGARLWSTYYGGEWDDVGYSCAVDGAGNVYLAGHTESTTKISGNGFQNFHAGGGGDTFLAKFSSTGGRIWATYYGGNSPGYEFGTSCAVDGDNNVYLAGITSSASGIASGGYKDTLTGFDNDAFLVKFNSGGNRLWATYYGGVSADGAQACAVDRDNNVYLAGFARSNNLASGGFQNNKSGEADGFLVKFNPAGGRLWATYCGGSGIDQGRSCATDSNGNVYLAGSTESETGIASGGFQNTYGGGTGTNFRGDAFLVKISPTGSRLWGSYYGGQGTDYGLGCAVTDSGHVYLAGYTGSRDNISFWGYQNDHAGGNGTTDAFLLKIDGATAAGFTSIAAGNWNNPAIWSGGIVPTAGSRVIVTTSVTVTVPTTCLSVYVMPSGSITVDPAVTFTVLN